MKVLFVTKGKADNINNWSGLVFNIYKTISKYNEVDILEIDDRITLPLKLASLFAKIYKKIFGKSILIEREPFLLKYYAENIRKKLKEKRYDLLFAPTSLPFTYLTESDVPKVFWTDALFNCMTNYYPYFSHLSARTLKWGNKHEQMALNNCELILLSSDWAKYDAVHHYKINNEKVHTQVFGANIATPADIPSITTLIDNRVQSMKSTLNLLFVGVDWERKGGKKALEVTQYLHHNNINAKLYVVGCTPKITAEEKKYAEVIGFLNKHTEEDREKLFSLYMQAHFFLLPTINECFGIVFCEASSLGLPSLTRKTGGVESAVDETNGCVFDFDAEAKIYGDYIIHMINNPKEYETLGLSSFKKYQDKLNWDKIGEQVQKKLESIGKDIVI